MALVIVAVAAVWVLRALATVSQTLMVADNRFQSYGFAASKMPELVMQIRHTREWLEGEEGSFRVHGQGFHWQAYTVNEEEDPLFGSLTLAVSSNHGTQAYEEQYTTSILLPKEEKS